MGVTYIGISFMNSRSSEAYGREAMAIAFANAGTEFAINIMGRPSRWYNSVSLAEIQDSTADSTIALLPKFSVRTIASDDPYWKSYYATPSIRANGRVIETQGPLAAYGIIGNPGLYGHWSILVYPEEYVSGVPRFNINFRVITKAWIKENDQPGSRSLTAREVMARVSCEFPGSIYQNLRSYDACGGFGYPNEEECTSDAVFVTEGFDWDGGIRIDGPAPDGSSTWKSGKPWKKASPSNGWADKDTSGSLKISLLESGLSESEWPKFNGKILTQKTGISSTESGGTSKGIFYDNSITDLGKVFKNSKDPYQTGVSSMNIMDSLWIANDGTGSKPKLGYFDGSNAGHDGFFKDTTDDANGATVGYYTEATNDDLRPDLFSAYKGYEAPTFRVTVIPLQEDVGGAKETTATGFFIQKLYRDQDSGELTPTGDSKYFWSRSDSPQKVNTESGSYDWDQAIYIKGGNVQVMGGNTRDLSAGSPDASSTYSQLVPSDGDPGNGHLTVPVSIISDTNINRDESIQKAVSNNGRDGDFDARLTTANVYDKQLGKYVFQCYDEDTGERLLTGDDQPIYPDKAIWQFPFDLSTIMDIYKNDPDKYSIVYPPPSGLVNAQPEGNLSVIGDLMYSKGTDSPSLGLLAKNHVFLNDLMHPDPTNGGSYETDPDALPQKQILTLDATIGSENHSMQMDFFNFNHKSYSKIRPDTGTHQPTTGNVQSSDEPPPSVSGSIRSVPDRDGTEGHVDKWAVMPVQARNQYWADFWFGSDQTCNNTWKNYSYLYQQGKFVFNGAILTRFADVEADAKGNDPVTGDPVPGLGYIYQSIGYDPNLKNRSAPYFSTSCYDKTSVSSAIYWSVLTYVDKGALSELLSY